MNNQQETPEKNATPIAANPSVNTRVVVIFFIIMAM